MNDVIGTTPRPKNLGDIARTTDSGARPYIALLGDNLGQMTLKFSMPIQSFIELSAVGNRQNIENIESLKGEFHAQRNLIRGHAVGLGRYTLMGLVRSQINDIQKSGIELKPEISKIRETLGNPAYASLQPIVTNIRNCARGGSDLQVREISETNHTPTAVYEVMLSQKQRLWVVDGQHRREGFDLVLDFLRKVMRTFRYPKKGLYDPEPNTNKLISESIHSFWSDIYEMALSRSTISIECHLGLNTEEEQQLFYDLNSKGRRVQQSLAFQYDHTDPLNKFVAEELIEKEILPFKPSEKDTSNWKDDNGTLARKDVNSITCLLGLGKTTSKNCTPALIRGRKDFMIKWWQTVVEIDGFGRANAKTKTVAAQPVVLKALAKLSFDLVHGHKNISDHDSYAVLLRTIEKGGLDFSHENKIWTALMLGPAERREQFPGMEDFVHVPVTTNLDAGVVDTANGWVRFGSKHNDIYPRLGDIIRWKVGLKARPSVTKAIKEMEDV